MPIRQYVATAYVAGRQQTQMLTHAHKGTRKRKIMDGDTPTTPSKNKWQGATLRRAQQHYVAETAALRNRKNATLRCEKTALRHRKMQHYAAETAAIRCAITASRKALGSRDDRLWSVVSHYGMESARFKSFIAALRRTSRHYVTKL